MTHHERQNFQSRTLCHSCHTVTQQLDKFINIIDIMNSLTFTPYVLKSVECARALSCMRGVHIYKMTINCQQCLGKIESALIHWRILIYGRFCLTFVTTFNFLVSLIRLLHDATPNKTVLCRPYGMRY